MPLSDRISSATHAFRSQLDSPAIPVLFYTVLAATAHGDVMPYRSRSNGTCSSWHSGFRSTA